MNDIILKDVSKTYGTQRVLAHFSARIPAGKSTALVGTSGAGKTTLSRLMMGLEKPDMGRIEGRPARVSCVFQENRLCPGLSAGDNVRLVLPHADWNRVDTVLMDLGLGREDLGKPARNLSGGQKRRVALARAVEAQGELLILDEAFKGLDKENRLRAYQYVKEHLYGRTLLLITHDLQEAQAFGASVLQVPLVQNVPKKGEEKADEDDIMSEGKSSEERR